MRGHNICLNGKIRKNIPKLFLLPLFIRSSVYFDADSMAVPVIILEDYCMFLSEVGHLSLKVNIKRSGDLFQAEIYLCIC